MLKNFLKSRRRSKEVNFDNDLRLIESCDAEMQEFHFSVTDTILEKTGEPLNKYSSHVIMGFLLYETQAAIEIAKFNQLPEKLYEHVAAKNLIKAGLPQEQAYGIVHGFMKSKIDLDTIQHPSLNGKTAYLKMKKSKKEFVDHIEQAFQRLTTEEKIKNDIGV